MGIQCGSFRPFYNIFAKWETEKLTVWSISALFRERRTRNWLVYPYEKAVHQFVLNTETDSYQLHAMYGEDDCAVPVIFPACRIGLEEVFGD
jgi:hypothetical protein